MNFAPTADLKDLVVQIKKVSDDRLTESGSKILSSAALSTASLDAHKRRTNATDSRPAHDRICAAVVAAPILKLAVEKRISQRDLEQVLAKISLYYGIVVPREEAAGYIRLSKDEMEVFLGVIKDTAKTQQLESWAKAFLYVAGAFVGIYGLATLSVGQVVLGAGICAAGTQVPSWREHRERIKNAFPKLKQDEVELVAKFAAQQST